MAGLPTGLIERSQEIHEKLVLRGSFGFDEDILRETRRVDYQDVQEKIKRYRLFLEEIGAMELDACDVQQVLATMRALKEKADCLRRWD
jgi:hypothetical protein